MNSITLKHSQHSTFIFICLMAMVFSLSPLAIDMYLPAFPEMGAYFSGDIKAMEASLAIYLLAFAFGQLIFGSIADSVNKGRMLFIGLLSFAFASLLVALSEGILQLYVARVIQGVSSATSVVVFALIHDKFSQHKSNQIISYVMAAVVVAPMLAPIIGSQLLISYQWQSIFYLLAIIALSIALLQLACQNNEQTRFVKTTTKAIDVKAIIKAYKIVFSDRLIMLHILAGASVFAGLFAFVAGSPFVYMQYFKVSAQQYALLMAINAIAMIVANLLNATCLKSIDSNKKLTYAAVAITWAGIYLLLAAKLELGITHQVMATAAFVACLSLISSNAISNALSYQPKHNGLVSGVNGILQFSLGAISSAIISISFNQSNLLMNSIMAICALSSLILIGLIQKYKQR